MLRFAEACTKDDAVSALGSSSLRPRPHALRVLAYVRFCDRAPENGRCQVRPSDVTDIRILDAMLAVPREAFVPDNKQALAYLDLDLDVSEGGAAKRFLIQPAVLAKMLQAAEIKESDRVLVVAAHRIRRRRDRPNSPPR